MMKPTHSPWGKIQTCKNLCPGAYAVSTASHSGTMILRELADHYFLKEARKCGFTAGAYLCFAEDYDEPVALRELMDRGLYAAPVNEFFGPGTYEAVINDSLQSFHPEYWKAREQARIEKKKEGERNVPCYGGNF